MTKMGLVAIPKIAYATMPNKIVSTIKSSYIIDKRRRYGAEKTGFDDLFYPNIFLLHGLIHKE